MFEVNPNCRFCFSGLLQRKSNHFESSKIAKKCEIDRVRRDEGRKEESYYLTCDLIWLHTEEKILLKVHNAGVKHFFTAFVYFHYSLPPSQFHYYEFEVESQVIGNHSLADYTTKDIPLWIYCRYSLDRDWWSWLLIFQNFSLLHQCKNHRWLNWACLLPLPNPSCCRAHDFAVSHVGWLNRSYALPKDSL